MSDVKYPHGMFSWVDLTTTDANAGKAFYTGLFGWTYNDVPIGEDMFYTMFQLDGKDVAALSQMGPEQQAQGRPSTWNTYVTVDNVDGTAEAVTANGGVVMMPPFDVFDSGRMTVIQDPTGAILSIWQAKNHVGARVFNVPNSLVWNEVMTRDGEAAKAFYTSIFGWTAEFSPEANYTTFKNDGRYNGGMIVMTEDWPADMPPHWMAYFATADCDAMAAKAEELGGRVHVAPRDIPGTGRFAIIQDPQGATFTIMQMEVVDDFPFV